MKYKILTNHIVITYPIDINWIQLAAFFEVAGTPIRRGAASPAPAASSQCVAVKKCLTY